ncbi:MAG: hypothetical protein J5717_09040 [Lachnospiraceae bacterium]|nr:hypothetical protein [Lachnospiraceae bacterium]
MNSNFTTNTGNKIVDAVGKMNITGNVIPEAWYNTIVNSKGKLNMVAALVLSEIVYWYRPREIKKEDSNEVEYQKRFQDDEFVQLGYNYLCKKFNLTVGPVREGIKLLESLGVVKRHLKDVKTRMGTLHNVVYIELIPEGLERVTYPANVPDSDNTPSPTCDDILRKIETYPSDTGMTNTEITCETHTETTTTAPVAVDSFSKSNELFKGLKLKDSDIKKILSVSKNDISKCKRAIDMLNSQTVPIRNVTGWLIKAIQEDYQPIHKEPFTRKNSFNEFIHHNYDFAEIEHMVLNS